MNSIAQKILPAVLCCFGYASTAQAAEGEGWDWIVEPYIWAAGIGIDLQTPEPPAGGIDTDVDFSNVLEDIDEAFEVHIEGQGEQWGMFTDFTYLGLADEHDRPRFHTESDLDLRLFELAAVWNPGEGRFRGLDMFAGLRYIDVDLTVQLDPENTLFDATSIDGSDTFSDFMLGARYTWELSGRWHLALRGDGSFGDTGGTWNGSTMAAYSMKDGAWFFGYRHLSVELEARNKFDVTMSGPVTGYGFVF